MSRHLRDQQSDIDNKENNALVALDEDTNKGSSVNLAVGKARMMAGSNSPKLMNNIWDPADLTMITSTSSPANCLNIWMVRTPTGWMNLLSEGHYEVGDDTGNPNHERVMNTPYDRGKITPMMLKTKLFLCPPLCKHSSLFRKVGDDLVLFFFQMEAGDLSYRRNWANGLRVHYPGTWMSENLNNFGSPCLLKNNWRYILGPVNMGTRRRRMIDPIACTEGGHYGTKPLINPRHPTVCMKVCGEETRADPS